MPVLTWAMKHEHLGVFIFGKQLVKVKEDFLS